MDQILSTNFNDLKYFTDYEKDKSVRIGVCALVGKISKQISSHKAGWPTMIVNQLKHAGYLNSKIIHEVGEDWSNYDVILIDHGMEFKGVFNIFGGANDDLYNQLCRIFRETRMYSLHVDMPDIGELVKVRLKTGTEKFKTLENQIPRIKEICSKIPRVDFIEKTDKMIFGDSHCFSVYRPGYMVLRLDGATLYGTLNKGLSNFIFPWIKELIIYMGNIDVRHHLMRQQDPTQSVDQIILDYEDQLKGLGLLRITVVQVLPVENESRKIPKTGWYKKMPFFGSQKERAALSSYINWKIEQMCQRNDWNIYKVPENFFNDSGELTFDVMEKPQSVHISREFHYWDYEQDKPNTRIIQ